MGLGSFVRGVTGMFRSRASAAGPVLSPHMGRLLWPDRAADEPSLPLVWDTPSARHIPAVSRAVAIFSSLVKQMGLEDMRGLEPQPLSTFMQRPDPLSTLPRFLQVSVEDYLQDGNTVSIVVSRDSSNMPTGTVWVPIQWVEIEQTAEPYPDDLRYFVASRLVDRSRVIHVRRGADRTFPARGVGVIEEHIASLDRVAREEAYEAKALKDGGVPSVAVISPSTTTSEKQLEKAKVNWMAKFAGGKREPVMLPGGTQVIPLSWSPADAELQAARKLSLTDVANMFNLDGYWLGAPSAPMTYQSPTPMFNQLRVVSLENVLKDLEAEWSLAWLPRGRTVRFDRLALTRDDLSTTVSMLAEATDAKLITIEEARVYMGRPPRKPAPEAAAPPVDEPSPDGE
jgi:HK97 family phage portal protein